jgi:CRP-like cAMP-binding protein
MESKHDADDKLGKEPAVDIRACLESLPLFSELSGPEIELLAPLCRLIEGGIGHYILEEGVAVHTIFFMISGEANVRKEGTLLATVGKGAVLGEMSLLNHASGFATIQAKCPFKAIAIEQAAFARLLEEHARLGYKILKKIARLLALRLMMTDAKLSECMNIPHDYQHENDPQTRPPS